MVMPGLIMRPQDWDLLVELLRTHLEMGTKIWAFGSRVGGRPRPTSDLDMVIFGDDLGVHSRLREALEESNLPFAVDLHSWSQLPHEFQAQISEHHLDLSAALGADRAGPI